VPSTFFAPRHFGHGSAATLAKTVPAQKVRQPQMKKLSAALQKLPFFQNTYFISVSDPDSHGSAFNWSPGSGARRVKKS
jgi:hypothetical protein